MQPLSPPPRGPEPRGSERGGGIGERNYSQVCPEGYRTFLTLADELDGTVDGAGVDAVVKVGVQEVQGCSQPTARLIASDLAPK